MITHLEPDILAGMWSQVGLRKYHPNKASRGDGIPVELFQILKDDAVQVLLSICQRIWKTQQWPQDWKRSVFIPIPKKGNAKECSDYCTIALISYISKVMLKILQARLQQVDLKKADTPEIKWPTSVGSLKKQESSRKRCTFALLTMPKPLTVWIITNWKILQEIGIPDHLTCLLRNMYAGQEATFRTRHVTIDWFQIEKGVCQGCILSPSYLI